jgi:hypothetical protein
MATIKLNKRDKFAALIEAVESNGEDFIIEKNGEEFIVTASKMAEFLANEITLIDKKNATERKPDPKKVELYTNINAEIVSVLSGAGRMTIGEMQKGSAFLAPLSNQQMSYALREMEKDGRVVKTVEKRKNYYELVEGV